MNRRISLQRPDEKALQDRMVRAAQLIHERRWYQDTRYGDSVERRLDHTVWLTQLVQEVGQLARVFQEHDGSAPHASLDEALDVAATAHAIVEVLAHEAFGSQGNAKKEKSS